MRRLPPQQHSQELGPCARLSVVTVSASATEILDVLWI